jgi:hypothetical protein
MGKLMKPRKLISFGPLWNSTWPTVASLRSDFSSGPGTKWYNHGGNDTAGISVEGVDGTAGKQFGSGRIDLSLELLGHEVYGVFLFYRKTGESGYASKGDMRFLKTFLRTKHDDLRPLSFFIPFDKAWLAVEDFMTGDGARSSRIEWVPMSELAGTIFPDPDYVPAKGERIVEG